MPAHLANYGPVKRRMAWFGGLDELREGARAHAFALLSWFKDYAAV